MTFPTAEHLPAGPEASTIRSRTAARPSLRTYRLNLMRAVHTPPGNWKPKWGRPKVGPGAIKPVRIRYYRNPLGRLVKLHQSYQEMSTGLVYRSPFERQDARFR